MEFINNKTNINMHELYLKKKYTHIYINQKINKQKYIKK